VCKAILYGVDSDCLEDASQAMATMTHVSSLKAVRKGGNDEAKLKAWRKEGHIGKLHNTVIHIKDNASRRTSFESKQRQARDSEDSLAEQIYRVVVNVLRSIPRDYHPDLSHSLSHSDILQTYDR
jgi:hypothetical protein